MCITNIYVDAYPDGREVEYRHLSTCQYGSPGRPCAAHATKDNPVRRIQYGEPSTQHIFNHRYPSTPPRSAASSQHRDTRSRSRSDDGRLQQTRRGTVRPTRQHRKERIVVVDAPPTPITPPLTLPYTPTTPLSTLLAQLHATHPQLAHQHLRFISSGRLLPPHLPLPSPPPPFLHVSISTAPSTIPTAASAASPQRGFNRLLAAGFTHAEVAALRSEFRESGSGGGVEEEERWIEEGGTDGG